MGRREKGTDFDAMRTVAGTLIRCLLLGGKKFDFGKWNHISLALGIFACWLAVALSHPWVNLYASGAFTQCLVMLVGSSAWAAVLLGGVDLVRLRLFEKKLENASVTGTKGYPPKVKDFKKWPDGTLSIDLDIKGIDPETIGGKRRIIESTFDLHYHGLKNTGSPRNKVLWLTSKNMPKIFHFRDAIKEIRSPYHVVIGRGMKGSIVEDITTWPHGLIAGSTGSGKSVQMKSIVSQLIHSSPKTKIVLCDLKGGVEFSVFDGVGGVQIHSDIGETSLVLREIVNEMDDRFSFMKKQHIQQIVPEKHGKDFIFIAIDEASLLFRRKPKGDGDHYAVERARYSIQKILKLGRAAGISVLFGLQRPSKESLDTEVQENIDARICFKINTVEGSVRMLGHKKGVDLPAVPGRGIWKMGSEETIFQAPYTTNEDIKKLKEGRKKGIKRFSAFLGKGSGTPPSKIRYRENKETSGDNYAKNQGDQVDGEGRGDPPVLV